MSLKGKTIFISGGSRGIGKAIALRLAAEGANIAIAAKTVDAGGKLEGTIHETAEEITAAGGFPLAVQCDVRDEENIQQAVKACAEKFGGIDVVINNASAIYLLPTEHTSAKQYDLMMEINVRGSFLLTQACLPYLKKSNNNPQILTLSPPLDLNPKWFAPHVAYTLSKYNMTMLAMGWAAEFSRVPIASNSLWPRTTIATAAVANMRGGEELLKRSRNADIMADAVYYLLLQKNATITGKQLIDEEWLRTQGVSEFGHYAVDNSKELFTDLFLDQSF